MGDSDWSFAQDIPGTMKEKEVIGGKNRWDSLL